MKEKIIGQKRSRKKYSPEFKDRALTMADKVGVAQTATPVRSNLVLTFHSPTMQL